ncbi:hypothetical protein L1887_59009 [Cichorium endivia]|nr:hypothetical protein L1887_59009 [Cichorium endivia]
MLRRQAYKFRIEPTGEQQRKLRQFAGACRFVFNKALAVQQVNREEGGKYIGYVAMAKYLTAWRNGDETPWLKDAPVHPLQHALKDLDRAYQNFFAQRADFPRFKKRGQRDSFRYPRSQTDQARPGKFTHQPAQAGLAALSQQQAGAGHGEERQREPQRRALETVLQPLNSFKRHQHRLAKAQRQMSHKTKFSNNWKKAKARVQRINRQIADARNDYLHKATHAISQSHALVCVEDLKVGNMSRSAKGTVEQPGQSVRQKSGLNRAILDQGWGEFRRQLDYKAQWAGGWLVAVPPQQTSQQCPECGHTHAGNRQTQALFLCLACGHSDNADRVGSRNIRERGLKTLEGQGHAPIACEVNGAVWPSAAGTRRSEEAAFAA